MCNVNQVCTLMYVELYSRATGRTTNKRVMVKKFGPTTQFTKDSTILERSTGRVSFSGLTTLATRASSSITTSTAMGNINGAMEESSRERYLYYNSVGYE